MKSGFKDPIAIKNKEKVIATPWNFEAPDYDHRSGCYIQAGTDYGVGKNQPVGRVGNPKMHVDTLPYGKVKTEKLDD